MTYYTNSFIILQVILISLSDLASSNLLVSKSFIETFDSSGSSDVWHQGDSDKECVGNRIEALEIGRQCSRRCKKSIPCENTRKQCLCDGLCGLSCIKPDLSCPELPKVENGDYSPKSNLFNTKVTYRCDPGYYLFGSRERLCQGDEEWSGVKAECLSEPQCHDPIKVNHARNPNEGTYRLDEKVYYSCYPGYEAKGNPESICKLVEPNQTAWIWTSSPFKCIPMSCGDPGHIENGKRHGDSFIIASSVTYTCNDGYELIGQARRFCQSNNQWAGQAPHCEPITCNPTDHLENGRINYGYPLIFNSTVEYSCDYGFRLVGPKTRTCESNRKLSGEAPTCLEIDCGQLGPLPNGYIKGYSSRMGDKKEFICMDGMKFEGSHKESVCLETGAWSNPLPRCMSPCLVPSVEHATRIYLVPADPKDGSTVNPIEPGQQVSHGSYLEIVCDKNYEIEEKLNGNYIMRAPMCYNETWTHVPRCKPASCRFLPPNPKNGRIRVVSVEHGAKGFVRCLDGFRLVGDNFTQCVKGNWTPIKTSCVEIHCGFPGIIEHGKVLLVGLTGMYDYKPYIKRISNNRQIGYECEVGYHMNDGAPNGATCLDGQWKPDGLPTCIKG